MIMYVDRSDTLIDGFMVNLGIRDTLKIMKK